MTNNDRLQQIIANVQSLSDLIKSMIDAEMYPVSFFSQGFDLIQKIQSDFHTLEADQVDMFAEQLKKHQALILSIHQQMRIFSTQTQVLIPPAIEEATPVSHQKPFPEQPTNVTQAESSLQPARIPAQTVQTKEQIPKPEEQIKEQTIPPSGQTVKTAEQITEQTKRPPVQSQEIIPSATESSAQGEPLKPAAIQTTSSTVKEEATLKGEAEQNKDKTKKNTFLSRLGFSPTSKIASKPETHDVSLIEPERPMPPEPPVAPQTPPPVPMETPVTPMVRLVPQEPPVTPQTPPPVPTETPTAKQVRFLPPEPPVTHQAPPPIPREAPVARPVRPLPTDNPAARPVRPLPTDSPAARPVRPLPTDSPVARPTRPTPPDSPVTHQTPPPVPTEATSARPTRPVPTDSPAARPVRPVPQEPPVTHQAPPPIPMGASAARPVRPAPADGPVARPIRPTPPEASASVSHPMGEVQGGASVPSFLASVGATRNETIKDSSSKDAQHPSINDAIEKKKLSDLRKAFSLNDRFRYRKELFGGSEDAMNKVINILNNRQSFNECVQFLEHKLHWDFNDPTVKDFVKILEIRFL